MSNTSYGVSGSLVSGSIGSFLKGQKENHPGRDLLERFLEYGTDMETQVNVAAGQDGEPVANKKNTWTDGINEWWNIRIPKKADSEPEFKDYPMS